jgi:hypothetical protein
MYVYLQVWNTVRTKVLARQKLVTHLAARKARLPEFYELSKLSALLRPARKIVDHIKVQSVVFYLGANVFYTRRKVAARCGDGQIDG